MFYSVCMFCVVVFLQVKRKLTTLSKGISVLFVVLLCSKQEEALVSNVSISKGLLKTTL